VRASGTVGPSPTVLLHPREIKITADDRPIRAVNLRDGPTLEQVDQVVAALRDVLAGRG
jgi:hypothetical protein